MKYFEVSNNGTYRAKIILTELHRSDAVDIGKEIADIVAIRSPVIVDFAGVEYVHKDCLLHMLAAAYEKQTNGTMPVTVTNLSPSTLKKLQTLVPQETRIYSKD